MGPGRKICIDPYGTKTTKAVIEGLTVFATNVNSDLLF